MADTADRAGEIHFGDQLLKLAHIEAALAAIAGKDDGKSFAAPSLQKRRGFDQHAMAFALAEARRQEHDLLVRRRFPGLAQTPHAGRVDRARRKAAEIDAAIDDRDALARL